MKGGKLKHSRQEQNEAKWQRIEARFDRQRERYERKCKKIECKYGDPDFFKLLKEHGDYEQWQQQRSAYRRSCILIFLTSLNVICWLLLIILQI